MLYAMLHHKNVWILASWFIAVSSIIRNAPRLEQGSYFLIKESLSDHKRSGFAIFKCKRISCNWISFMLITLFMKEGGEKGTTWKIIYRWTFFVVHLAWRMCVCMYTCLWCSHFCFLFKMIQGWRLFSQNTKNPME